MPVDGQLMRLGSGTVVGSDRLDDVALATDHGGLAATSRCPGDTGMLARWQMDRLSRHIEAHMHAKLSQASLAAEVRLSASHFARAFRRSFGLSPHCYVTARRMDRARALLRRPEQRLSDIALVCGLSDQAHLSRLFKQDTGSTPSQWRRRYAESA